jgi:hypothetical protein
MITVTVPAGYRVSVVVQQDGTIVVILEPKGLLRIGDFKRAA